MLLEACPASFLKRIGAYEPYKGDDPDKFRQRCKLLQLLAEQFGLRCDSPALLETIAANRGGDALDSVLAAVSLFARRHLPAPFIENYNPLYQREGFVYH